MKRDRVMRTIVFFDLPDVYAKDRRNYQLFRRFLMNEGFIMMQESVYSKINQLIGKLELPLCITNEFNMASLLKLFQIEIMESDDLLTNLLLIIDVERLFHIHDVIVFVNIKQFLSEDEVTELENMPSTIKFLYY